MKYPNFFIVGAPKCGTTALYDYLRVHPQIYLPPSKEFHFFGSDLHYPNRPSAAQYVKFFEDARDEIRIGEGSTSYLFSKAAATEIREACPSAKIIIMLRNPVEMMYSLHSEMLYWGNEVIEDFAQALALEEDRKAGKSWPEHPHIIEYLFYRDVAQYTDQIVRYRSVFEPQNLRIIIHDDCKKNMAKVYRETLRFLEVDETFETTFTARNPNKRVRSRAVQEFVMHPPGPVRWVRDNVMPQRMNEIVFGKVRAFNTVFESRVPMDQDLSRRLRHEFAPEVKRLGELLGRDLTHWTRN
jgi:hypothetical protein